MSVIEQVIDNTILWWRCLDTLLVVSGITAVVVVYLRMRNEGRVI